MNINTMLNERKAFLINELERLSKKAAEAVKNLSEALSKVKCSQVIKLKHNKTYIDRMGSRIKVKSVNGVLFRGDSGKMYYYNGVAVSRPFAHDLVK